MIDVTVSIGSPPASFFPTWMWHDYTSGSRHVDTDFIILYDEKKTICYWLLLLLTLQFAKLALQQGVLGQMPPQYAPAPQAYIVPQYPGNSTNSFRFGFGAGIGFCFAWTAWKTRIIFPRLTVRYTLSIPALMSNFGAWIEISSEEDDRKLRV